MLASWHVAVKWGTSHSSCRGKMGEVFQNPPISPVTMRVTGARVDRAQPDIPGDVRGSGRHQGGTGKVDRAQPDIPGDVFFILI